MSYLLYFSWLLLWWCLEGIRKRIFLLQSFFRKKIKNFFQKKNHKFRKINIQRLLILFEEMTCAPATRDTQSKRWVFTVFVEDDSDFYNEFETVVSDDSSSFGVWAIIGKETCPSTGKRHGQGYMHTRKPVRRQQVIDAIMRCGTPHPFVEKAKEDAEWNFNYCTGMCEKKNFVFNENHVEYGIRPTFKDAGKREVARWDDARRNAEQGRYEDIPSQILISHLNNLKTLHVDYQEKRPLNNLPEACGFWITGLAGSGKSHLAREWAEKKFGGLFLKPLTKWACGLTADFKGAMLLEDYAPQMKNDCSLLYHLKIWADKYPFKAEVKGSSVTCRPSAVIVTSQYTPDQYGWDNEGYEAIMRRFRVFVVVLNDDGTRTTTYVANTGPGRVAPAYGGDHHTFVSPSSAANLASALEEPARVLASMMSSSIASRCMSVSTGQSPASGVDSPAMDRRKSTLRRRQASGVEIIDLVTPHRVPDEVPVTAPGAPGRPPKLVRQHSIRPKAKKVVIDLTTVTDEEKDDDVSSVAATLPLDSQEDMELSDDENEDSSNEVRRPDTPRPGREPEVFELGNRRMS